MELVPYTGRNSADSTDIKDILTADFGRFVIRPISYSECLITNHGMLLMRGGEFTFNAKFKLVDANWILDGEPLIEKQLDFKAHPNALREISDLQRDRIMKFLIQQIAGWFGTHPREVKQADRAGAAQRLQTQRDTVARLEVQLTEERARLEAQLAEERAKLTAMENEQEKAEQLHVFQSA